MTTGATPFARLAVGAAIVAIAALAGLHIVSPEYDPSWRMVSEYALGPHSWLLSVMFIGWAVASWALAALLWPHLDSRAGRIGLVLLVASGVGEAMAGAFDIRHPLHNAAAMIGIPTLPVAAMLISLALRRAYPWSMAKGQLLWAANLTWISLVMMAASFAILIATYGQSGAEMTGAPLPAGATLPTGVIALVGWTNRLLIGAYCGWIIVVAWHSPRRHAQGAVALGRF